MKKQFTTQPRPTKKEQTAGILTLVNSTKNGRRMSFPLEILESIGFQEQDTLQFLYDLEERSLDVGIYPVFGMTENGGFKTSIAGKKVLIYNSQLIQELVEIFSLDYSDCVSKTFGRYKRRKKKNGERYLRIFLPETEIINWGEEE